MRAIKKQDIARDSLISEAEALSVFGLESTVNCPVKARCATGP
jgi:hypothetical protein